MFLEIINKIFNKQVFTTLKKRIFELVYVIISTIIIIILTNLINTKEEGFYINVSNADTVYSIKDRYTFVDTNIVKGKVYFTELKLLDKTKKNLKNQKLVIECIDTNTIFYYCRYKDDLFKKIDSSKFICNRNIIEINFVGFPKEQEVLITTVTNKVFNNTELKAIKTFKGELIIIGGNNNMHFTNKLIYFIFAILLLIIIYLMLIYFRKRIRNKRKTFNKKEIVITNEIVDLVFGKEEEK